MEVANATHVRPCMELNQVPNIVDQLCDIVVGDIVYTETIYGFEQRHVHGNEKSQLCLFCVGGKYVLHNADIFCSNVLYFPIHFILQSQVDVVSPVVVFKYDDTQEGPGLETAPYAELSDESNGQQSNSLPQPLLDAFNTWVCKICGSRSIQV